VDTGARLYQWIRGHTLFASLLNNIKVEVSFLLGYGASSCDHWCLTLRDSMVVVEMYWMLEDKRAALPGNTESDYPKVQRHVPET
jgi:hypothetical protein